MNKSFKVIFSLFFSLLVFASTTLPVHAQLFSADQQGPVRRPLNVTSLLTFSVENVDFEFQGIRNIGPFANNDLSFNSTVIRFAFEDASIYASLALGGSFTGLPDNQSYVNLKIKFSAFQLRLIQTRFLTFQIPVEVVTDLTSVQDDTPGDDFQQSAFAFGGGGRIGLRLGNNLRLISTTTYNFGFGASRGGFFGGEAYFIENYNRLIIGNLIPGQPIALGYGYTFRSYDIDGNLFDYDIGAHSFSIGIPF